jgi:hypothetical protein
MSHKISQAVQWRVEETPTGTQYIGVYKVSGLTLMWKGDENDPRCIEHAKKTSINRIHRLLYAEIEQKLLELERSLKQLPVYTGIINDGSPLDQLRQLRELIKSYE